MTLVNSHLANMGRRLAGVPLDTGWTETGPRPCHVPTALPKTPDRGRGPDADVGVAASGPRFELTLSDNVQAILLLAASASGLSHGEAVARAIVFWAQEAVGMPGLCDELTRVPDFSGHGGNRFQDCGGP